MSSVFESAMFTSPEIVLQSDPAYESRRQDLIWNGVVPDRFPHGIVSADSVAAVQAVVKHAADNELKVSVRSGGHSYIASCLRDQVLVLDVSALNNIEIDIARKQLKVGPGARSGEVVAALAPHGLAFPVGHCRTTAMGGYLLGGGQGINWNSWGMACHSVVGFDYVDQDGILHQVDDDNFGDLMWLARGCGPAFPGVITAYYLQAKSLPSCIRMTVCAFALDAAPHVASWVDTLTESLSSTVELFTIASGPMLGIDATPSERFLYVGALAFESSEQGAEAALAPFLKPPMTPELALHGIPQTFDDVFSIGDSSLPPVGTRLFADSVWSNDSVSTVMGALKEHMAVSPSPSNQVMTLAVPPANSESNASFSMSTRLCVTIWGVSDSAALDEANKAWVARASEILEPYTAGFWVSEADLLADTSRARRSYTPEVWTRARSIRKHYDPSERFVDYISTD